jgi:PAS domain S-box-containing protein
MTRFSNEDLNQTELLKLLEGFGFGSREAIIYVALHRIGKATALELSRKTRSERSDTYRVLKSLIGKGFVTKILDEPTKYAVISSKKSFRSHIEGKRRKIEELESTIEQIDKFLESIKKTDCPDDTSSRFELIKTRRHVYDRAREMISSEALEQEFLFISKEFGAGRILNLLQVNLVEVQKRKASVRCLVPVTEENLNEIKTLSMFADIRHIPASTGRLLIANRKETLQVCAPDDTGTINDADEVGLWSNNKQFAQMQGLMFDSQWRLATDLHSRIREIEDKIPEEKSEFFTKRHIIFPIEEAQTVVFLIDPSGRVIYVSNNISQITGHAVQTYLNGFVEGMIDENTYVEDKKNLLILWERAKKGETGVEEFRTFHSNGTVIWWSASWLPIRNQKEDVVSIRVILKNITEKKRIELMEKEWQDNKNNHDPSENHRKIVESAQ